MKIVFHRYGSICEPDLIDAFTRCGLSVIEDDTEIYQKSITAEERIRLLGEQILIHKPAFVFSINFFPYISEICEKLHTLYVALSVDCPVLELFSVSIRNKCNRIFLFDYMQYEKFHPENPDCIFYLPLAVNTERWDTVLKELTPTDYKKYTCDISFVGSLYTEKSPLDKLPLDEFNQGYIDGLTAAQLNVSDYNFLEDAISPSFIEVLRQSDPDFYCPTDSFTDTGAYVAAHYYLGMHVSALERILTLQELGSRHAIDIYTRSDTSVLETSPLLCFKGGVSTHTEMPKVFHCSRINLNITMKSIQTGLSQRIWDVLGCRGFLLTNYQSEIPEYFEIGTDLECYENTAELLEKVQFYLTHDDIRQAIAENGYQKVKAQHTYIHRVLQILKTVFIQK
ncbi:MAG: glycosyltransferase [Lachnospiraceae bacterium]|nr:glycosyltransferase [Lachnospiraceae bacterium]